MEINDVKYLGKYVALDANDNVIEGLLDGSVLTTYKDSLISMCIDR